MLHRDVGGEVEFLKRKTWLLISVLLWGIIPLFALPKIIYPVFSFLNLPGTGELLLGHNTRGATLLGADLVNIIFLSLRIRKLRCRKRTICNCRTLCRRALWNAQ
jgi:hypothetical protein